MGTYYLMHKDQACGMIVLDDVTGNVLAYKNVEAELTPFLGNASIENIKKWWMNRAIPANRDTIKALINSLEISTSEEYLAKNLALSVTDTYWICPVGAELKYEDINFFNLRSYNDGKILKSDFCSIIQKFCNEFRDEDIMKFTRIMNLIDKNDINLVKYREFLTKVYYN